ncbi:MAG: hypothetical protein K0R92_818 [Lachnospiraceae bacterium]|jgi:hypothetical protein|nr:hypothetical protein [Lachnospiraceae bacterium]
MLYTVVPLERIYSYQTESVLIGGNKRTDEYTELKSNESEYASKTLSHGRIYAKRNGDEYMVDRIVSTDMNDYLNPIYAPGSVIDINKSK